MNNSDIGELIRSLRRERGLTQLKLAEMLNVSDRAVSKWETGRGCPDVSLLRSLADIFGVNVEELLKGEMKNSDFVSGNMKNAKYFVCPNCLNLVLSTGEADVSCCGRRLKSLTAQKSDGEHELRIEKIENDWFIECAHEMTKAHYISFVALASSGEIKLIKTYPEWDMQVRLPMRGHGVLLWYCTRHGLFYKNI